MSQTQSSSRKRPYGLQRVCRVWQFPRSTVNEHRRRAALCPEERPEPKNEVHRARVPTMSSLRRSANC